MHIVLETAAQHTWAWRVKAAVAAWFGSGVHLQSCTGTGGPLGVSEQLTCAAVVVRKSSTEPRLHRGALEGTGHTGGDPQ